MESSKRAGHEQILKWHEKVEVIRRLDFGVQIALKNQAGAHGPRSWGAQSSDFLLDLGQHGFVNLPPEFDLENVERLAGANEQVHLAAFAASSRPSETGAGVENRGAGQADSVEHGRQVAQNQVLARRSRPAAEQSGPSVARRCQQLQCLRPAWPRCAGRFAKRP
jgi:hypothetical protein